MCKLILGALFLTLSTPVFAGNYIVKYKAGAILSLSTMDDVQLMDQHPPGRIMKVSISQKNEPQTLKRLKNLPQVEYVVKDFKLKAFRAPLSNAKLKEQWAIAKVNAEKAWSLAGNKGSKNIVVAVIDTGVDYNHESLSPNAVKGYDFRDDDSDPMDKTGARNPGHGTHCAGIVGATGFIDGGTIGIAPNISIMPIRFLGADGSGDLAGGIKSIDYAIEKGVDVISASWGASVPKAQAKPLIEAVQRASDAGIIFVAAAANDGKNNDKTDVFPANAEFENTITVAASGPQDEKPSWSNYGRMTVHLAAPGLNIMSTLPKDKYSNLSGTSMATPLVSGLVALLKSQDPSLTGKQIRALLQSTGTQVKIETACNCRVDAGQAMKSLLNKDLIIAPAAFTAKVDDTKTFEVVNASGTVTYESENPSVGTIDTQGNFKAISVGETRIHATDATGRKVSSLQLIIANAPSDGGGGGGGGGGDGSCPLDPALCDIACGISPELPWCTNK